jgi:L-aminopeptidase/D-esterase-like protein
MQPTRGITGIEGILVGWAQDEARLSGCTVVLFEGGSAETSYIARGGWPGAFDTEVLGPGKTFTSKHALLLTGGDVYGFAGVRGVIRYLVERGIAEPLTVGRVPNVAGANIYDLWYADATRVDYEQLAYAACLSATRGEVAQGNFGAGIGATVGKFAGRERAMKGGQGSHLVVAKGGVAVGALVIVNAVGNVYDFQTGRTVAGARGEDGSLLEFEDVLSPSPSGKGTTLAVVATDVPLSRDELRRVAEMADDGLARAIRPAHMSTDGDTVFAVSTGKRPRPEAMTAGSLADLIGHMASEAVRLSVIGAVKHAKSLRGIPGLGG